MTLRSPLHPTICTAALTLLGVALAGCTAHHTTASSAASSSPARTQSAPASTVTATSASPAPAVANRWKVVHAGGGATAATVAAGRLWVAYARGTTSSAATLGELVGYSLASGRPQVTAPIGAEPAAIAATDSSVWVANGIGDGSIRAPALADTVEQFSTTGRLLSTTPVPNPLALAANDNSVSVYYATAAQQAHVRTLRPSTGSSAAAPGTTDHSLPGESAAGAIGAEPLAYCAGKILAVSVNHSAGTVTISQLGTTVSTVANIYANASLPSLTCADSGPLLLLPGQPSVLASAGTGYRAVQLSAGPSALAAATRAQVWLADDNAGTLSIATVTDTGSPSSAALSLTIPSSPLLATDATGLWVIVSTPSPGSATLETLRITHS